MSSRRLRPRSLRWLSLVLIAAWLLPMVRSVWAADSAQIVCSASGHVRLQWSAEPGDEGAGSADAGAASCVLCVLPSLPPDEAPALAVATFVPPLPPVLPAVHELPQPRDGPLPARGPPARTPG